MTTAEFWASVQREIDRMVKLGEQDALADYPIVSPFDVANLLPQFERHPDYLCICPTCGGTGDNCRTCSYGRGYLTKSEGWKR